MISNKSNKNLISEILEGFATTGISQLRDFLERLFNQLMLTEREDYVQAGLYERTPERRA